MLYSYLFFKCVVFNLYSNLYEKQILKCVNIKMSHFIVFKQIIYYHILLLMIDCFITFNVTISVSDIKKKCLNWIVLLQDYMK